MGKEFTKRRSKNKKGKSVDKEDFENKSYRADKAKPNDPRWYAQNEALMRDSASMPFSWPLGNHLNFGDFPRINKYAIPGIMTLRTLPTYGKAEDENAPINVAMRNIYSYVRHANNGHTNYDAPDLMIYLMAMDQIVSYISFLKRAYGVMMTASYVNRYFPKAMIESMGLDFDDLQSNLADFRYFINSYLVKAGAMCVPANMSIFARHSWMYEGLYYDTPQDKAQVYMYTPLAFYRYALDENGAGSLELAYYKTRTSTQKICFEPGVKRTLRELIDYGNMLLNPIIRDEDMNIMSGDILKAYGQDGIIKLATIDTYYTTVPVFSEEVLDQIQNATICGSPANIYEDNREFWTIHQKTDVGTGFLLFNIKTFIESYHNRRVDPRHTGSVQIGAADMLLAKKPITFDRQNVTPSDVMVATRLSNIAKEYVYRASEHGGIIDMLWESFGSEIISTAEMWVYSWDHGDVGELRYRQFHTANFAVLYLGVLSMMDTWTQELVTAQAMSQYLWARISHFNRHPLIVDTFSVHGTKNTSESDFSYAYAPVSGIDVDINYNTMVDADNLRAMNETALLSEFNVTQYGLNSILNK